MFLLNIYTTFSSDLLRTRRKIAIIVDPEKPVTKFYYLHLDVTWNKSDNIMRYNPPRIWYNIIII